MQRLGLVQLDGVQGHWGPPRAVTVTPLGVIHGRVPSSIGPTGCRTCASESGEFIGGWRSATRQAEPEPDCRAPGRRAAPGRPSGGPGVTLTASTSSASRSEPSCRASCQLALGRPPQLDPVAHVEPGALAGLLHQAHHLADEPGAAQLRADLEVERHGLAPGGGDRPPGARGLGDDHLVGRQRDRLRRRPPPRRCPRAAPAASATGSAAAIAAGDRLDALAEPRAERPEVGLDASRRPGRRTGPRGRPR